MDNSRLYGESLARTIAQAIPPGTDIEVVGWATAHWMVNVAAKLAEGRAIPPIASAADGIDRLASAAHLIFEEQDAAP